MKLIHSSTFKDQGKNYIYVNGDKVVAIKKYRQKNHAEEGLTQYKLSTSSFFLIQLDNSDDLYLYGSYLKKSYPLAVTSFSPLELSPVISGDTIPYLEYMFSNSKTEYSSFMKSIKVDKEVFSLLPIHNSIAKEINASNINGSILLNDTIAERLQENTAFSSKLNSVISYINQDNAASYFSSVKRSYGYPYSISDMSYSYQMLYSNYLLKTKAQEMDTRIAELINPFSFGVEIETSSGVVNMASLLRNNFVFLRDGSLDGGLEYTSLPLKGADGIAMLRDFCNSLKVCSINEFCSLHIHLGSINLSKEDLVSLYKTVFQCQQELFDFVPSYKRSSKYFAKKAEYKDHCKPLKSLGLYQEENVDQMYRSIYNFVTMNGMYGNNEDVDEEDDEYYDEEDQHVNKWNKTSRYHHLNLLNWFEKSSTIEFRLHEPTTNYQKIISWLLIIVAITKYAKKYNTDIINNELKISLMKIILDIYPPDVASYLNKYIKHRTIAHSNSYIKGIDEDYHYLKEDSAVFRPEEFDSMINNRYE